MTPFLQSPGVSVNDFEEHYIPRWDIIELLQAQFDWQTATFGPATSDSVLGVIDHLEEEIEEVKKEPKDLEEWIDIIILATGGANRAGYSPQEIMEMWVYKNAKNKARKWPPLSEQTKGKKVNAIKEQEVKEDIDYWFNERH